MEPIENMAMPYKRKGYGCLALVLCFICLLQKETIAQKRPTVIVMEHTTDKVDPRLDWWNLLHYTIAITPTYEKKYITGTNEVRFEALRSGQDLAIDLQDPMTITSITWKNKALDFVKKDRVYTIHFPQPIQKGSIEEIDISFAGVPVEAHKPPFDNGWIWTKDKSGRPWMSIACEGSGASIWLPCKELSSDEPDQGVTLRITVPDTLVAVANGRLEGIKTNSGHTATYTWVVTSTINNYNIVPCIGKYVTWHRNYAGLNGRLDCDFWVLDYNLDKAKKHLVATDTMLACFEYWLGPYPFYKDSYKLIESPMPGMEHQSGIAYGNGFENSYRGVDMSGSGWGMKWDFILVHESGHEWFGNSVSAGNNGESWLHEGFTKYLETLYTDFVFGKAAGNAYAIGNWKRIRNNGLVIDGGTSDTYYKSAAMLHMIRQLTGDKRFREILHAVQQNFYHQTVTSKQVEDLINSMTGNKFMTTFDQYLRSTEVPVFDYKWEGSRLQYRWTNCVHGFDLALPVNLGKEAVTLSPTDQWKEMTVRNDQRKLVVDSNFYVKTKQMN